MQHEPEVSENGSRGRHLGGRVWKEIVHILPELPSRSSLLPQQNGWCLLGPCSLHRTMSHVHMGHTPHCCLTRWSANTDVRKHCWGISRSSETFCPVVRSVERAVETSAHLVLSWVLPPYTVNDTTMFKSLLPTVSQFKIGEQKM